MPKDPLDLFNSFPDYPGKTPPKNRQETKKKFKPISEDRLNGAKSTIFIINGVEQHFYLIGDLAKALNRRPVTIRKWELDGWLPKAKYRTTPPKGTQIPGKVQKGRRLYSLNQVEFLLTALSRFEIDNPAKANWEGFRQHIKTQWPND